MEIFVIIRKYNTRQLREEGNPELVVNYFVSILPPLIIVSIYENWDRPINVQWYGI